MGFLPMLSSLTSLLGGAGLFEGKEVEPKPLMPPGMTEEDYKRILEQAEGLATQQHVAPINDLMKFAYSIPLQYYMGQSPQDISIPGIQPFSGGMGGLGGMPAGGGGGAAPWMNRGGAGGGSAAPWMNRGRPAPRPRQKA
jgi:hypothetical protein